MASAAQGTAPATITLSSCDTVKVNNTDASAALTVALSGLHEGSEKDVLIAGEKEYYRLGSNESHILVLSGSATYAFSIVCRRSNA